MVIWFCGSSREKWMELGDGLSVGGEREGGVKDDFWVASLHN